MALCQASCARAAGGVAGWPVKSSTLWKSGLAGQVIGLSVFAHSRLSPACPRPQEPSTSVIESMQSLGTTFGRHRLCAVPVGPMPAPTCCTLCTTLSVFTPPRPGRPQRVHQYMHACIVQLCTKFHVRGRRGWCGAAIQVITL